MEELREKASHKKWRREVGETFEKEVSKLERINPQSPDYNVQLTYLQTLLALPWDVYTDDVINIPNAEKVLNKDHYGLEKVKERILEHLAVLKLKNDLKSPIICLYGPPGVGKTSLGRSIAAALKRKYVRMSLGGVHDEAEIRGHRKTYIGAMPGRIIKVINKIAMRHTGSFEEMLSGLVMVDTFAGEEFHPRLIAWLLRMGDLCDLDNDRFNRIGIATFGTLQDENLAHYFKHCSVETLYISIDKIRVIADINKKGDSGRMCI